MSHVYDKHNEDKVVDGAQESVFMAACHSANLRLQKIVLDANKQKGIVVV